MNYTKGELGQCQKHLFGGRGFNWQCQKKAVVQIKGKNYCKIHDPEYIAAKRKAWDEKWRKDSEESRQRGELRQAQLDATRSLTLEELQLLNPNLCKVAPEMYEALKLAVEKLENEGRAYEKTIWICEQAIAKAEGK